ncbi:MAG: hypothetical protein IPJ19_08630 [Planctomycetes bacterium]|nr:hypothetical protein [Planctomycetota bacterium]
MNPPLRLRALPFALRAGLTGVALALLLGLWASLDHLRTAHEKRDELPGLSLDDLVASYHGIHAPARLAESLRSGHAPELPQAERESLLAWLGSKRVAEDFDNPDLGAKAPAEILAARCTNCHARKSQDPGARIPLEYWDDVKKLAFARELPATPLEIVTTSLHAHASSMALLTLAVMALCFCTRWPAWLRSGGALVGGLALVADLSSWLSARESAAFVYVIAAAGALWSVWMALALVSILLELWLPERERT